MTRQLAFLLLFQSLLSGCGLFEVSPVDPSASDPQLSATQASEMQRTALRAKLGVSAISSHYWAFDLFRSDVEQEVSGISLLPPIPMILHRTIKEHSRYTLVAYDQSGYGNASQTGIVRNPPGIATPIGSEYSKLYLRAGELLFFMDPDWGQGVNLLATPISRDVYLSHARMAEQCTVILGCGKRGCADRLAVDEGPSGKLPIRAYLRHFFRVREAAPDPWLEDVDPFSAPAWFETLVAVRLNKGEHTLEFSAEHLDGAGSLKLSCQAGAVTYVVINPAFSDRQLVDWQIEATDTMPALFSKRPLLLVSGGEWYVDQEPKN